MSEPRQHEKIGFWDKGFGQILALALNLVTLAIVIPLGIGLFIGYLWIALGTFGYGMQWLFHTPGAWWKFLGCAAITVLAPVYFPPLSAMLGDVAGIFTPGAPNLSTHAAKSALRKAKWNAEGVRLRKSGVDAQNAKAIRGQFSGGQPCS